MIQNVTFAIYIFNLFSLFTNIFRIHLIRQSKNQILGFILLFSKYNPIPDAAISAYLKPFPNES